eukprot:CAMPEP_0114586360 /NCGR_PEP_ID=MMETSP0125-20121206/9609_1 /TAXON_ID=485358 ORGANISM="Aristerostoma sp., Strain ATCC 50986" /NCGR_SAMPLE_ID=MMETSP0125 /ASSEMBLY_ACC=CAM_ASM_000245 /LENGTH=34 /DNA_ID= /DNA_START= /DNA_END= /DNA_ORIENTATION=
MSPETANKSQSSSTGNNLDSELEFIRKVFLGSNP